MRRAGVWGWRSVRWRIGAVFCVLIAGCAGSSANVSAPAAERASVSGTHTIRTTRAAEVCAPELGSPDRRLTRFELAHAVEDVFGIDAADLRALPAPVAGIGDVPDILVG